MLGRPRPIRRGLFTPLLGGWRSVSSVCSEADRMSDRVKSQKSWYTGLRSGSPGSTFTAVSLSLERSVTILSTVHLNLTILCH